MEARRKIIPLQTVFANQSRLTQSFGHQVRSKRPGRRRTLLKCGRRQLQTSFTDQKHASWTTIFALL